MAQTMISIRVDSDLKQSFDMLCKEFGISSSAAMNMFMKAVVRERRIPFEIKADPGPMSNGFQETISPQGYHSMAGQANYHSMAGQGNFQEMPTNYGIPNDGYIPDMEGIMYDSIAGGEQINNRKMTVDDISYEAVHAQLNGNKNQ